MPFDRFDFYRSLYEEELAERPYFYTRVGLTFATLVLLGTACVYSAEKIPATVIASEYDEVDGWLTAAVVLVLLSTLGFVTSSALLIRTLWVTEYKKPPCESLLATENARRKIQEEHGSKPDDEEIETVVVEYFAKSTSANRLSNKQRNEWLGCSNRVLCAGLLLALLATYPVRRVEQQHAAKNELVLKNLEELLSHE